MIYLQDFFLRCISFTNCIWVIWCRISRNLRGDDGGDQALRGRKNAVSIDRKAESEGTCSFTHLKDVGDKGYIERDVNKADRRNTYVKLTASGEQKQEECEQIMSSFCACSHLKNRPG